MTESVNIIDHIKMCEEVLNERDVNKAKLLRKELTRIYSGLIPRWNHGLIACITEFYLDDIEVIKAKLTEYKDKTSINYFRK